MHQHSKTIIISTWWIGQAEMYWLSALDHVFIFGLQPPQRWQSFTISVLKTKSQVCHGQTTEKI
jgi:hypothetical protein